MLTPIFHKSPEAEAFDKARHDMTKAFMRLALTQGRDVMEKEIEATRELMNLSIEVRREVKG